MKTKKESHSYFFVHFLFCLFNAAMIGRRIDASHYPPHLTRRFLILNSPSFLFAARAYLHFHEILPHSKSLMREEKGISVFSDLISPFNTL